MAAQAPNYFVIIPTHILDDDRIDDATAILFGRIASLSNNKGYCFASDQYLGKLTGVCGKEVGKRLLVLEKFGYIKRETKKVGMYWDRKIYPNFNYETATRRTRARQMEGIETAIRRKEQDKNKKQQPTGSDEPVCQSSSHEESNTEKSKDTPKANASLLLKQKMDCLKNEQQLGTLSDSQIMQLSKNHTLEDIRSAVEYFRTQDNIEKPYSWLSNCIRKKFWENADPEEIKQVSLFDSFKTAINVLCDKNGLKRCTSTAKDYIHVNASSRGFELHSKDFRSEERICQVVDIVNNSFTGKFKLHFVKLPGKITFEVL